MELIGFALLASAVFLGWGIGANDAANAMGTAVGAGVWPPKVAARWVAIFGLLGALALGTRVAPTIGKSIFPMDGWGHWQGQLFAVAVCLGAGLTVALSTRLALPTSTSHAIVGAVVGCGMAWNKAQYMIWPILARIFAGWVLTPVTGFILGWAFSRWGHQWLGRGLLKGVTPGFWKTALILGGACMAFAWGANDVANVAGPLMGAGMLSADWSVLIGGMAMGLGVIVWGSPVMGTVGTEITRLSQKKALAAEIAAAINIIGYTLLGLPASSSQTVVAAVFGVGWAADRCGVRLDTVHKILAAWVTTPLVGYALGFGLFRIFRLVAALLLNLR